MDAKQWGLHLKAPGLSSVKIARRVKVDSQMFRRDVQWGLMDRNPFSDVKGGSQDISNPASGGDTPADSTACARGLEETAQKAARYAENLSGAEGNEELADRVFQHRCRRMPGGSIRGKKLYWARRDSNPRPSDYESPALTAELRARKKKAAGFVDPWPWGCQRVRRISGRMVKPPRQTSFIVALFPSETNYRRIVVCRSSVTTMRIGGCTMSE